MLLRPRKTQFKSFHKKRSLKLSINSSFLRFTSLKSIKLSYGQFGVLNKNITFLFFNKYIFKIKLFLKKAVRRTNITNRFLWLKIFPHIPISKKVIGSRMGKGKGKPSNWAAKIPYKSIFIELGNARPGRTKYFLFQIAQKLPGKYLVVSKYAPGIYCTNNNGFSKFRHMYNFFY
jgi:large subunit ribosomal protein L16